MKMRRRSPKCGSVSMIQTQMAPKRTINSLLMILLVAMDSSSPSTSAAAKVMAEKLSDVEEMGSSLSCDELLDEGSCTGEKDSSNSTEGIENTSTSDDECTWYLALSSIPNSGFGMYTTKFHENGSRFLENDIPTIPVVDMKLHHQCQKQSYDWIYADYVWESEWEFEYFESNKMDVCDGMLGSLANYHPGLVNSDHAPDDPYEDSILDRFVDPGAGAYSYQSRKWQATKPIYPGQELFVSYGDGYLDARAGYDDVPRQADFETGRPLLGQIMSYVNKKTAARERVDDDVISTFKDIISTYNKRVASAFPRTYSDLLDIINMKPRDPSNPLPWSTLDKRSIDWIKQNGVCLDNLRMDKSTIKQAGHGAFARRSIAKGQIVTPAPLLQVKRDVLKMYNLIQQKGTERMMCDPNNTEPVGEQLLANYCFGHGESSWLFCTPSNALLINHCSDRQDWGGDCGGKEGPNAMYRWSTGWDKKTKEWLGISVEEMEERNGDRERGLSLEIVATRDIQPGEEIFFDYGAEWEEAWNSHVENWKPPTGDFESFSSVTKMNDAQEAVRTREELVEEPYAPNVLLMCVYWEDLTVKYDQTGDWKSLSDDELISRYGRSGEMYVTTAAAYNDSYHWPCSVYKRDGDKYVVRIEQSPQAKKAVWSKKNVPCILTDYPRESFSFYSKQYTSDLHLPDAFRQPIGIRDDIFPEQWKDLTNNSNAMLSSNDDEAGYGNQEGDDHVDNELMGDDEDRADA